MSHSHGAYKAYGGAILRRKEGLPCYPCYIQQSDLLRVRSKRVRVKSKHSEIDDFVIAVGVKVFQGRLLSIPAAAVKGKGRPILLP